MWRMNKLIGETTGRKNEIKKQNMRDLFQCKPASWRAAERSMIKNHKRVNETGQAMNEATACISLSPFSQSMNCFIMIKDKTGVNDTFTFSHQRETWLNLDESSWGYWVFSVFPAGGRRQLKDDIVETCNVCLDTSWNISLLGSNMLVFFPHVSVKTFNLMCMR